MKWRVKDILEAIEGQLAFGDIHQEFDGIGIDSRTIRPGELFVAICGTSHDAHTFLSQVVAKGVRGVVIQKGKEVGHINQVLAQQGGGCFVVEDTTLALGRLAAYQRQKMRIPVVAITGSNGKTTTRQMTAMVMAQRFNTLVTDGNFNNEIGLPLTLFRLSVDHQAAVLELGMNHFGEMERLGAICRPTIAVITNAGPAHLEFLGNVQGVARAKGELLDYIHPNGHAVLNADDEHVAALAKATSCAVCMFGTTRRAEIRAEAIKESAGQVTFDLILPHTRIPIELATPGRFMVSNALAAAAVGHLSGIDAQRIKAGLETFAPIKGRLNIKITDNGIYIIDDTYNANPASMAAAIGVLVASKSSSRGFIVLGDMLELGEQAEALHRQVGRQAGEAGIEKLYAVGQHAEAVLSGARQAGMADFRLMTANKEDVVADLLQNIKPADWVLVKGSRGMTMETIVAGIQHWVDGNVPC